MLNQTMQQIEFHKKAIKDSVRPMIQSPFSAISTLLVLAITLTLPTLFWTASDHLKALASNWNSKGQLTVYYKIDTSEERLNVLQAKLTNTAGVAETRFISAKEGLAEFRQQEGMERVLEGLPHNPLPAASVVIPTVQLQTQAQLQKLQQRIQTFDGVDSVQMDAQWIYRLQAILNVVNQVANLIIVILAIAVVLIISNTLRLSIQNNREELRVLKLIGASQPYILRPFLYSGIIYGLLAALLALILGNLCIAIVSSSVRQLAAQYDMSWSLSHINTKESVIITMGSVLLGWLAARISVSSQLKKMATDL